MNSSELAEAILWKLGLAEPRDRARAQACISKLKEKEHEGLEAHLCETIAKETLGRTLERCLHGSSLRENDEQFLRIIRQFHAGNSSDSIRSVIERTIVKFAKANSPTRPLTSPAARPMTPRVPAPVKPVYQSPVVKPFRPYTPPTGFGGAPPAPYLVPVDTRPKPGAMAAPQGHEIQKQPPYMITEDDHAVEQVMDPPHMNLPAERPKVSAWKYLPLPEDEPDPHTEFEACKGVSPDGYELLGARVRGKKHKHDGTHCDDWFSFETSGKWTVMAVSDGGGSYRFSRVGAKAACEAATKCLGQRLADHSISERTEWTAGSFEESDLQFVYDALVEAMTCAWEAVQTAVVERSGDPAYEAILGHPLTTRDLYCTLLLAVHVTIPYQSETRSLILGLAVGDGMMAVIDQGGTARLLMTPDSGEHSGEVRFLDQKEVDPERLRAKIRPVLCPLRSLMLMTDGVADDYFPNDPGMAWLYGDLVLNGVLPVASSQAGNTLVDGIDLLVADCSVEVEQLCLDQTTETIQLRSLRKLAEKAGITAEEVVRREGLLQAGRCHEPTERAAQLQKWLDSYFVRGSFDDRTLLVMHR